MYNYQLTDRTAAACSDKGDDVLRRAQAASNELRTMTDMVHEAEDLADRTADAIQDYGDGALLRSVADALTSNVLRGAFLEAVGQRMVRVRMMTAMH